MILNSSQRSSLQKNWTLFPGLVWLCLFILIPLLIVVMLSFLEKSNLGGYVWNFSLVSYSFLGQLVFWQLVFKTLLFASTSSFVCLFLGFICAWVIASNSSKKRWLFFSILSFPSLISLILKIYSIKLMISSSWGDQALNHIPELREPLTVLYGMIITYLPFAIVPLYGAFDKFDFSIYEAAQELGAGFRHILRQILIPHFRRSILNAFILVFIPCMGEFLIPDLLGGAKNLLMGHLVSDQFLKSRNWPLGAAMATLLIALLLVLIFFLNKVLAGSNNEDLWKN